MGYIKVPTVFEKLKKAEEFFSPVIMTAASGWGKTASVEYYYRRKNPLVLRCAEGNLTERPALDSFRGSVVIIEDMQWLSEEESIRYVKGLLHESGLQVVMLTRGAVPKFLAADYMDLGFVRIREKDFALGEREVIEFFKDRDVELHPDDVEPVTRISRGYPRSLYAFASRMDGGIRYSEDIRAAVRQDLFRMWDGYLTENWMEDFLKFALCVCRYDEFTVEMAEYLTGNGNITKMIEYCQDVMNQLEVKTNGHFAIRWEMRGYYIWKQELTWSKDAITENYLRAAEYYERKDDASHALLYYRKAGATRKIKELLVRNARMHPGTGHFIETREYYFEMPREELLLSPVLMSGMSMLCSLLIMPEKSEEWYHELELFRKDPSNRRERRREAKALLAYLDIALPHRGIKGILLIMKNVFSMIQAGDIILPEFCVTGNTPSVMNGGLDFSEWSKNDTQIARFMGKPLTSLLAGFGKGLVTLALAESGFEKGMMPAYEVLTRCADGYDAASHGGKIEMCFVSAGIQIRQHLVEGQYPSAKRVYDSIAEKIEKEGADRLVPNLKAFGVWLSLFGGAGDDRIREFIDSVPDARVFFAILDRYRQMMKIRCLIHEERLEEALDLANFLTSYLEGYARHFMWMENEILKSVILYRQGDAHWKKHLIDALHQANEYHFVRLISLEGTAVLPLLKELDKTDLADIEESFFKRVYDESLTVATNYPAYMKYIPKETVSLTTREAEVLAMLCAGQSTEEICAGLNISYDGLKKHNRNIYKKLGVKSRADAERKALQLGLVHRGGGRQGG